MPPSPTSAENSSESYHYYAKSNEAFPHPPWQFTWKSPEWHRVVEDDNDKKTSAIPLNHAAAQIEIPRDVPLLPEIRQENPSTRRHQDDDDDNGKDDDDSKDAADSRGAGVYTLTVTLAAGGHFASAATHPLIDCRLEGTDIWMQIWKQQQQQSTTAATRPDEDHPAKNNLHAPPASLSLVASRSLQWPAATTMTMTQHQQQKQKSYDSLHNTLVAIALARRPPPDALAQWTNALDVLHWLSLDRTMGLTAVQREWLKHLQTPETSTETSNNNAAPEADPGGELLLLCLDSHRVLHVYKMYDIWQTSSATVTRTTTTDEDGMAKFLFGTDLLNQVHTRILPLTQPWQQVQLSVRPDFFLGTRDGPSAVAFAGKAHGSTNTDPSSSLLTSKFSQRLVPVADLLCVTSSSIDTTEEGSTHRRRCGICVFVSLRTLEEVRTVYLPFVPVQLYPWHWKGWIFLLCVGPQQETCAIRVDGVAAETTVPAGAVPSLFQAPLTVDTVAPPLLSVGRFQIVPIVWPRYSSQEDDAILKMVVGSTGIHCAAVYQGNECLEVVQYAFGSIDTIPEDRLDLLDIYGKYHPPGLTSTGLPALVMRTETVVATFAISQQPENSSIWCHTREGWGLVGLGRQVYWIGWQGQRQAVAFCKHIATLPENDTLPLVEMVQPMDPLQAGPVVAVGSKHTVVSTTTKESSGANSSTSDPNLSTDLDTLILDAMESISALNYRGPTSPPASPLRRFRKALTQQEKSLRLLQQCSNQTRLEVTQESIIHLNHVQPIASLRSKAAQYLLTVRREDVEHVEDTPFRLVLSWLIGHKDYFTATSLALNLLKDEDSLQHLWESHGKIRLDKADSFAVLEGLLDGVAPLVIDEKTRNSKATSNENLVELADITISCLTKGGYPMSSTLERFCRRDEHFCASRAALLLVTTAAHTLSDDRESMVIAMGPGYTKTSHEDADNEAVLWPVRALLNVGTSRDMLSVVLLLLNATIPDTLRNRKVSELASAPEPSLPLCKALVSAVVAASPDAAELLLGLIDEQSRVLFWDSLDHETQLELCVVSIREDSPMLLQPAVRNWVLAQLQECLATEGSAETINVFEKTPNRWLQELVVASLRNARCSLSEVRPMPVTSSKDINDAPTFEEYCNNVENARSLILSAKGQFCIDFDLLIESLLVLERRGLDWWDGSSLPTQSVLNAACHFAGRRSHRELIAPLNAPILMRQCFLAGNVRAGANLVGGFNGLVLKCCHILAVTVGMEMDDSERFLLADTITSGERKGSASVFAPTEEHFEVLWLLREHVLRIHVFKEFTPSSWARGHVDPVAAARVCLRTWWRVSLEDDESTPWLVRWLQEELEITDNRSPHRLACAALLRAAIWPNDEVKQAETPDPSTFLASNLRIPNYFVTQLALSACGLAESVPREYLNLSATSMSSPPRVLADNSAGSPRHTSDISRLSSSSSLSVDG